MWEFGRGSERLPHGTPYTSGILTYLLQDLPLVVSIRGRGRVTLPKAVRERLSLVEGDRLIVVVGRNSIELVPADLISREHLWILTETIRSRIEAAEEDLSCGRAEVLEEPVAIRESVRRLINDSA